MNHDHEASWVFLTKKQKIWICIKTWDVAFWTCRSNTLTSSSPTYYANTTSSKGMQDVLVITLPQRNYTSGSHMTYNDTVSRWTRLCRETTLVWLVQWCQCVIFVSFSVQWADKWLCGWLSRWGSALWQSAQREEAQSATEGGNLRRASERQPLWKRLLLRCVYVQQKQNYNSEGIWLRDEGLKVRGVQLSWGSGVKTPFSFVLVKPAWGLVLHVVDHCWSENMKISLQRIYGRNGHSIVLWLVLLSPGNAARQYCKKVLGHYLAFCLNSLFIKLILGKCRAGTVVLDFLSRCSLEDLNWN